MSEEKWRIEAVKECNKLGITDHRSRLNFELGYLVACRKRQEEIDQRVIETVDKLHEAQKEIERLKEENKKLREALTPHCGFSTVI